MNVTQTIMNTTLAAATLPPQTTATPQALSSAATTAATAANTFSTCVEASSKQCIAMSYRYQELAASTTNSGVVYAVFSGALLAMGIGLFVYNLGVYDRLKDGQKRTAFLSVTICILGGIGCAVGASSSIRYDNQSILEGCIK